MGYQLIPALTTLRSQINAKWPTRDRESDGWVGDTSHQRRVSDHNPDANGWVHAIDVDKDGVDTDLLLRIATADARINYVIFDGHIYSRQYNFRKRIYTGINAHRHHMHFSAMHGALAMDGRLWDLGTSAPITVVPAAYITPTAPAATPVVKSNPTITNPAVADLQRILNGLGEHLVIDGDFGPASREAANRHLVRRGTKGPAAAVVQGKLAARGWRISVDSDFGPASEKVLIAFQREKRLAHDGICGADTYLALWTAPR